MKKKRILLVGEEQPLWHEFRDYASGLDSAWVAEHTPTGAEALALIEQSRFEAVVVDVQLSGMSGIDLLDRIMERQPSALRVILSDIADVPGTVKCVGRAHQHLVKPCDAVTLLHALDRAMALERWLPNEVNGALLAQMRWVPSPPATYTGILAEMRSPDCSLEKVGELIAQDPAIAAKVLQLANSAVFGLQLQVIHPVEAVSYIGMETTQALVLLAHTFSSFDQLHLAGFSAEALWRHSILTGQLAREIALELDGNSELTEQALAAGLLHDIGKLLFAANLQEPYARALALAREQGCPLWEAEGRIFGAGHAEVGASLLGIWGLPLPIVEAVALHHEPKRTTQWALAPLTAVHVANVRAHEGGGIEETGRAAAALDREYLKKLGLDQRFEAPSSNSPMQPATASA